MAVCACPTNLGELQDTDVSVEETDCESSTHLLGGVNTLQSDSSRFPNTEGYLSHALLHSSSHTLIKTPRRKGTSLQPPLNTNTHTSNTIHCSSVFVQKKRGEGEFAAVAGVQISDDRTQ